MAVKDYYVRQLRDMKGSMSVSLMDPHQLAYYGRLCGWALARAHARTGRAFMISGYLGGSEDFDHAIADFALAYAGQNERDYQQLRRAISDARILATVERSQHANAGVVLMPGSSGHFRVRAARIGLISAAGAMPRIPRRAAARGPQATGVAWPVIPAGGTRRQRCVTAPGRSQQR